MNCWEYMNCGFGPNHATDEESSFCPASRIEHFNGCNGGFNAGRSCWMIAETRCKGKTQGTFLEKIIDCQKCDFYNFVETGGSGFFLLGEKPSILPDDRRSKYEEITISSKMDDEQAILYLFRQLNATDRSKKISLSTFYKEMPITNTAEIIEIQGSKVLISTNELQLDAIRASGEAFIGLNKFAKTFRGIPIDYDIQLSTVTLNGFSYVKHFSDFREAVRVRLKKPLNVKMRKDDNIISGTILDISVSGCGMNILTAYGLDSTSTVSLKLKLMDPSTYQVAEADIPCSINIVDDTVRPYKVALKFIHDTYTEEVVSKFIYQRQLEILKEIRGIQ